MSKINGEKARAAIAKKRRTAQRAKDRATVAAIRAGGPNTAAAAKPAKKES